MQRIEKKTKITDYTTGACAAAAAKAAAYTLITGKEVTQIRLATPLGVRLKFHITDMSIGKGYAKCAVQKRWKDVDGVDDVINLYAKVTKSKVSGKVMISGGEGIGRFTKNDGDNKAGKPAITKMPRLMIINELLDMLEMYECSYGFFVEFSVPGGAEISKKTINEECGIEGGIAILGTTGVVQKATEDEKLEEMRTSIDRKCALGEHILLMAPKKYAVDFTAWGQPFKLEEAVICKDWVSEAVEHARRVGVKGILFVANISKALQLTGGLISLGADEMDIRMQALIAHGALHGISSETARALSRCINTEEGLELLREAGLLELTMTSVMDTLKKRFDEKSGENMRAEILVYSAQYGILGQTEGFQWLFDKMRQPAS